MIKKYIEFIKETRYVNVPDYFIELDSIGHYIDKNTGEIYAKLTAGGYEDADDEGGGYDYYDDIENVSEDDKRLVDSFKISSEELLKDKISLDLIDDIIQRCIDEGLVDEDVKINIRVRVRTVDKSTIVYNIYNDEVNGKKEFIYTWNNFFKRDADIVGSANRDDIYYECIFTYIKRYEKELKPKMDSIERFIKSIIESEYDGEILCSFLQLMDNYRTV
jgi:hypothetical protein